MDLLWNLLDTFIVMCSCLESAFDLLNLDTMKGASAVRIVRILRVLRLMRALRIARLVRMIASLRTLVYSVVTCLKELFWTFMLMVMLVYMNAIMFTQAYIDNQSSKDNEQLKLWWGSLSRSMVTLYQIIT